MLLPRRPALKYKRRVVSRTVRITPALDRELGRAARQRQGNKSFLIREILTQWLASQQARAE